MANLQVRSIIHKYKTAVYHHRSLIINLIDHIKLSGKVECYEINEDGKVYSSLLEIGTWIIQILLVKRNYKSQL